MVAGGSIGPKRQCKNRATPGSDYCTRHKDHPDRRVEAAKASLHDYVEDAVKSLGRVVKEGEKDADVIKAAIAILDRTGHGPTSTVTVQDSDDRLNQILRERQRVTGDREA